MNTLLAWFITFNFINIAWVFFRAKEWDDAVKVLEGMFGLCGLRLPGFLEKKLSFLAQYGVEFNQWLQNLHGGSNMPLWVVSGLIFILLFPNSNQWLARFKTTYIYLVFNILMLFTALSLMDKASEFLYFNF